MSSGKGAASSDQPKDAILQKDLEKVASEMVGINGWRISNLETAKAAVLAAAHKKPLTLRLEFSAKEPCISLSNVIEVLTAVKECNDVQLFCGDVFFNNISDGIQKSKERLAYVKKHNKKFKLTEFHGQLDSTGLSELPNTIRELGLAIGSQADVDTMKAFKPWTGLEVLHVSVSGAVTPEQLPPLPFVAWLYLYFPQLKEDKLDSLPPYIKSLIPKGHDDLWLVFRDAQLSLPAAQRLIPLLKGVKLRGIIFRGMDEVWKQSERDSIDNRFKDAFGFRTYVGY